MTPIQRRLVYRVLPRDGGGWELRRAGHVVGSGPTKQPLVDAGRLFARSSWELDGHWAQLMVHSKTGFQFENTYGNDPRRSKG